MLRVLATVFAALAGLAFGSFLNVCLTRWPQAESVVAPRSHCRNCNRVLTWWENIPLASWLALRGRCCTCGTWIGWRYPLVEFAVGALWSIAAWRFAGSNLASGNWNMDLATGLTGLVGQLLFYWLLVALAALDAELLWLPDWLTLPGIAFGIVFGLARAYFGAASPTTETLQPAQIAVLHAALRIAFSILCAAGLVLLIRAVYWLIRRREGMGLGDAKLMAMLAAWLGFSRALLSFGLGIVLGAFVALLLLLSPSTQESGDHWSAAKLPLGTFLCVGGIVASLWGNQMIAAYLHWAGFY